MTRDVFPDTIGTTWIDRRLAEGEAGRKELARHVMEVYREPLQVYFRGMPQRRSHEPADAVQGFLADRLSRPDFFDQWRANGMRLRRWLMNAFRFYLHELDHDGKRHGRASPLEIDAAALDHPTPEQEIDRAFKRSMVSRACVEAQASCQADGLGEHWRVFIEHFLHGRPYDEIALEVGLTPERSKVMARTARKRFELMIRDFLERDGVPPSEIDCEIISLLEGG